MHPYYESHKAKFFKAADGFLRPIAGELEEETGRDYPSLLQEILTCYEQEFLERFPFIGGDKSSGTRNLTGAYVFVAMGQVCRSRYGMTLEKWGWLTTLGYRRYMEKIPGFLRKLAGKALAHPGLINKLLLKKDAKNAANAAANPGAFETKTQTPTAEYPATYHTLQCPLANFAREFGYMDYIPYLCNLDYVMFELLGVPFYREHTCAAGDGYCDFRLKAGAPVNPAWPCHSLTPGDPLK